MQNWNDNAIMRFVIGLIIAVFIITAGWDYYVHREGTDLVDDLINVSLFCSVMSLLFVYRFVPTSRLGNWAKNEHEILLKKEKEGTLSIIEQKHLSSRRLDDLINQKALFSLKIAFIGLFVGLLIKAIQFYIN
jgi:hypothetical protein